MDDELYHQTRVAIKTVRNHLRWRPGKAQTHLARRREYGHIPTTATLSSYETVISSIVWNGSANVYLYRWKETATYIAVVGVFEDKEWLVMFGLDGIMETAFPPTDPKKYLSDTRFVFLGTLQEIIR
ncbi:MAG: hypothetical protein HC802_21345 [Caldilineaceae bacterium]|nr:hypothetical protein [Caldilineaceae bacterium]